MVYQLFLLKRQRQKGWEETRKGRKRRGENKGEDGKELVWEWGRKEDRRRRGKLMASMKGLWNQTIHSPETDTSQE